MRLSTTFRNETVIYVAAESVRYFTDVTITRTLDSIDTVEFGAPFDPNNQLQRDIFRPFEYQPVDIAVNDEQIFTGTLVTIQPTLTSNSNTISVGCYSIPGVLQDCPPPYEKSNRQFKKQNLHDIAQTLAAPFGIDVKSDVDAGPVFKDVKREPDKEIIPFLAELAQTRGQVMTNTKEGALFFTEAKTAGLPVAWLRQGESPLLSIEPQFDYSQYYAQITALKPIRVRSKKKIAFTVNNSLLQDVVRPHIFKVDDANDVDLLTAVQAKIGRMFGNIVSYGVTVSTWRDASGALWEPNTIVRLQAPGAMVYNENEFLIRSVTLKKDAKKETAELELVLPGSFTLQPPKVLPWEQ